MPNFVFRIEDATIREDATIDDMAAIASVRVKVIPTENGQGIEREIRLADKIRALDLLGKRFAMWTERQQIDANFGVQIIDDVGGTDEED